MLRKLWSIHLETVVSQVHHIVLVAQTVCARAGTQVTFAVNVNAEVASH